MFYSVFTISLQNQNLAQVAFAIFGGICLINHNVPIVHIFDYLSSVDYTLILEESTKISKEVVESIAKKFSEGKK